jgi:hypothetical protein
MKRQLQKNDNVIAWISDNVVYLCFDGKPSVEYNAIEWYELTIKEAELIAQDKQKHPEEITLGDLCHAEQSLIYKLYKQSKPNGKSNNVTTVQRSSH